MALSACYTAKSTNDKQRYLRVSVLGADKTTSNAMPVALYSTEVVMRDTIPEWMTEIMRGRDVETSKIMTAQGNLGAITTGNVTMTDKTVTLSLGDDKIFDLGKLVGSQYRSILKNMLVGELFKASTTDTSGVKPIGMGGNVAYVGGACPNFVYGTDLKYVFQKMAENRVAYGEGKTVFNTFLEAVSFNQIVIMVEVKTVHPEGSVEVQRAFVTCGGIKNQSADDQNKFSVDAKIYSDGNDYDGFIIDGGVNTNAYNDTQLNALVVKYAVAHTSAIAPTGSGTVGDLALVYVAATGVCTLWRCSGTTTWVATDVGTTSAGTLIFAQNHVTSLDLTTGLTTKYNLFAYKTGGALGAGTLINSTITGISASAVTLAASAKIPILDFDTATKAFVAYGG